MHSRRPHPGSPSASSASRKGFALIITITLLAFLVLLLVSLASLTRVETRVADNSQHLAKARQNALLALNLALGQLQKHAGPDQRVTARADVIAPPAASHTWATVPSSPPPAVQPTPAQYANARAADKNSIDSYWRASRNRQWTGVWKNHQTAPFNSASPKSFQPVPGHPSDDSRTTPAWLVSGAEETPALSPETALTGLSPASAATDDSLRDANGATHRLLVSARATDATSAADLDRLVTAPQRNLFATDVPGTDGSPTLIGHYAWWVGDEGVKARANLVDSHAAAATTDANRTRLQSAQRPAIEAMTTTGTDGLGAGYPANDTDLLNVFAPQQLAYAGTAAGYPSELKKRHHDLSVSSRGVLADTRHGGLKTDLTYLFGQSSPAAFRTALQAAYASAGVPSVAPSSASNAILSSLTTPYATLPEDVSGSAQRYSDGILNNSATWEQLWSFANQGSAIVGNEAPPRLQTRTEHGLYPLIMQSKLFFSLRIDGGAVWVDIQPVVVLANPYNVKLGPADYVVRFSGTQPRLRFGNSTDPAEYALGSSNVTGQIAIANVFTANTRFVLSSAGIEAGEAQIFTISAADNPGMTADDRLPFDATGTVSVVMKNDFDPLTAITINTNQAIPGLVAGTPKTHAALVVGQSGMFTALYLDSTGPNDPQKALQFTFAQYTVDPANGSGLFFLVDPISSGSRIGGGLMNFYNQPPGSAASTLPQQAPFAQVNYRALWINYSSSNSANNHPVEFARTYGKNGASAQGATHFNPWLDAHHMRPAPGASTTRWGIVNRGENAAQDQSAPQTLTPLSVRNTGAGFQNFLYDLPRPDHPLASLGQLQHFNTAGFITATSFLGQGGVTYNANIVHTWQINYPISNSYPHPRVQRDQLFFSSSNFGYHYDGAYLWNDALWDRFYFSTFPQSGPFDFATGKLANARYAPFRNRNLVAWDEEENFRGDGNPATATNARQAAQNLLVDGAFNINSTSVEAWKAVFSSLRNVPVGAESSPNAPYSRTLYPGASAGSSGAAGGVDANSWNGFRDLTRDNIQALAEEMVQQVRKRGPFLSLSDFVNRRLAPSASDPHRLGLSGALQAAIDRVVNQRNDVAAPLNALTLATVSNSFQENGYILPNGLAGFPGYLLQGDVLSALGSTISARSDTFTIRAYGDSVNPADGDVAGRSWCEAVVQRIPDYVDATAATSLPAANSVAEKFGRRFQIVSFRWLSPDDV